MIEQIFDFAVMIVLLLVFSPYILANAQTKIQ